MFWIKEKFVSLHRKTEMKCSIGLWCNGNTTDSGPVIPGSNPGSPTQHTDKNPLKSQVLVGFLGICSKCPEKLRWHMKMIGHDHFICHSYCHFSVLSHIILSDRT